jgi:polyketide cyclase/dehydrase/lipid transport protein
MTMANPRDKLTYVEPLATGAVTIDVAPGEAYRLISDPIGMAELAEEFYKARWIRGATEAAVGNWFSGSNRNGWHRWWTHAQVIEADPGRRFAYRVRTPFRVPVSRWEYDIEPVGSGCRVSVTNWLIMPTWFIPFAIRITGQRDRAGANSSNIATTLRRLKARAESRLG